MRVFLERAKGLQALSKDGTSDPIARLRLGAANTALCHHDEPGGHTSHYPANPSQHALAEPRHEAQHTSKMVARNRNPEWDETFDFSAKDFSSLLSQHRLEIKLQHGKGGKAAEGDLGCVDRLQSSVPCTR